MKSSRFRVLGLLVACLGAAAFWWFKTPSPNSGGAGGDGVLATWVKNRIYSQISPHEERGFTRLTSENGNGWFAMSNEPIQSFSFYQSQNPPRPTAARKTIVLQPLGDFNSEQKRVLRELQTYCAAFFGLPVRLESALPMPRDPSFRRAKSGKNSGPGKYQFSAEKLLYSELTPRLPSDAAAYLGITMDDLWVKDMSFVFGVGSIDNRVGVYSLARYFPSHGRKWSEKERQIGMRRSCQVLNHEMGHMIGIYHCVLYKCSMNGSNSLADADSSPLEYCPVCWKKLSWNTGVTREIRSRKLLDFYREHGLKAEEKWTSAKLRNS
ncbi:MAG TPA: archaemetzincin [Abditibacterium sp.]|jgi:archaemetzincin